MPWHCDGRSGESQVKADSEGSPWHACHGSSLPLRRTACLHRSQWVCSPPLLNAPHLELGARTVPFAGYSMPVHHPNGPMAELTDIFESLPACSTSRHMGQLRLVATMLPPRRHRYAVVDGSRLRSRARYGLLPDRRGHHHDDPMFFNGEDPFRHCQWRVRRRIIVLHIRAHRRRRCDVIPMPDSALLGAAGPQAVWPSRLVPGVEKLVFVDRAGLI